MSTTSDDRLEGEHWLVVGLGNPGSRYARNRHNVGFQLVEALAARGRAALRPTPRLRGKLAEVSIAGCPVTLLEPQTYMNLSGESVQPVAAEYGIRSEQIIAIQDDVDLAPGRLKLKRGGGDGGHKGIRSMAQLLDSADFIRLRVGVGRPSDPDQDVADFVLADFDSDEREAIDDAIARAIEAIQVVIQRGLTEAMNRFNKAPKPPRQPSDEEERPDRGSAPAGDPPQNTGSTG
jgi:PTH1 family peptidyl-tRNA hydrolase